MVRNQTIAFRCEASPEIGSGHVMRCLTLAKHLAMRGDEIYFLCSEETVKTVSSLKKSSFNIRHGDRIDHTDWLIVDHYGLDFQYETDARKWANNILVIDDLANRRHNCDLLIDMTYGRQVKNYRDLTPDSCAILTGSDYALIRNEFLQRASRTHEFEAPYKVLVSFGGVNPKGSTELTLHTLKKYQERKLDIQIVTGGNAKGLDNIQSLVEEIKAKDFHNATLHIDTPHIATIMADSHICIGAGGTMSWERCCLGLPTIAMEIAENQAPTLMALHDSGALINLGRIEDISSKTILDTLIQLINSPSALSTMSNLSTRVCDGRGAERVSCAMLPPRLSNDKKPVSIRYALLADILDVYHMQCTPGVRAHSRNPEPPTYDEHSKWYNAAILNPLRHLFIVLHDGKQAGIARLDQEENETYEVSILISPQFQGKGLAAATLKLLRSYAPSAIFKAEILPENTASHRVFDKAGYTPLNNDGWYISKPLQE